MRWRRRHLRRLPIRPVDVGLFLLGDTALSKRETHQLAAWLGVPKALPADQEGVLVRVTERK
jgi:hypothetical protein